MNILYYLHFFIPLSIILMPLLPIKLLKKVFFYPAIYYIIWIIFNGCPWTKISQKDFDDKENFLFPLFKKYIYSDINKRQSDNICNLIISLSIIVSAYKLLHNCKKL